MSSICSREVETVIGSHATVKDVAVIGIPHEKWGETLLAVVVLHRPAPDNKAVEADILEWCKERMAGYKRPRSIVFMADADMPRTATGKILHRTLREKLSAENTSG